MVEIVFRGCLGGSGRDGGSAVVHNDAAIGNRVTHEGMKRKTWGGMGSLLEAKYSIQRCNRPSSEVDGIDYEIRTPSRTE